MGVVYDYLLLAQAEMLREELVIYSDCNIDLVNNWSYNGWRTKTFLPSQLFLLLLRVEEECSGEFAIHCLIPRPPPHGKFSWYS